MTAEVKTEVDQNLDKVTEQETDFSEDRQNKLLRLLGGKKSKNADAASEWVHKSRSAVEEKSLKKGLEEQYNASLSLRLSGKARRHEGIGFAETDDADAKNHFLSNKDVKTQPLDNSKKERDRSRSPIHKDKEYCSSAFDKNSNSKHTDSSDKKSETTKFTKKNFYMQFAKAKDS